MLNFPIILNKNKLDVLFKEKTDQEGIHELNKSHQYLKIDGF